MQNGNQHHSDKKQALFKQDPVSGSPRISLRDYINQHLNGEDIEPEQVAVAPSAPTPNIQPILSNAPHEKQLAGQRLNSLDIEMGAGLEQYLPTPLFRLRVGKKRVSDDIAELKATLNKYDRLPEQSEELKKRIKALREHLWTLELHQAQIDAELESYLSKGSIFYSVLQQSKGWQEAFFVGFNWLRHLLIRLLYGKAYESIESANTELQMIKDLFAKRLQDRHTSDTELSQLLNQYEHMLRQAESNVSRLKTTPSR
jgi:uncharacterized protein YdcH (DUF465 family)